MKNTTLEIPDAYTNAALPGAQALGHFNPNVSYFSFWMPDGAPAGSVQDTPFFMWPGDGKEPMTPQSRTLVTVSICNAESVKGGGCSSPDQLLQNMINLRNYEFQAKTEGAIHIDPDVAGKMMDGSTPVIENIDWIDRFGAFHDDFGRASCTAGTCAAHFTFGCHVEIPYPPYNLCDGFFEMKDLDLHTYVRFIGQNPQLTLSMTETIGRLIKSWIH